MQSSFKHVGVVVLFTLLSAGTAFSQTTNSTYIYTGQIYIPDNGSSNDGSSSPWSANTGGDVNLSSGWHDVEFGSSDPQPIDVGSMNLFRPLTGAADQGSAGSIPEPASVLLLPLAFLLGRRRH
jgi:hypothetical protein